MLDTSPPRAEGIPPAISEKTALDAQKDRHQYEFACKTLEAQERDRDAHREYHLKAQGNGLKFCAGAGIVTLVIVIAAFLLNKEGFILEVLKYLFIGGGGGGVGFFFGYKRGSRTAQGINE